MPEADRAGDILAAPLPACSTRLEAHKQQLARTLAEMKGKRNVTVTSIEKTALAPFETEVKKANRDLELARDRACMQATPRSRGEGSVAYINEPLGGTGSPAKRARGAASLVPPTLRVLEPLIFKRLLVSEMGSEIYGIRQPLSLKFKNYARTGDG